MDSLAEQAPIPFSTESFGEHLRSGLQTYKDTWTKSHSGDPMGPMYYPSITKKFRRPETIEADKPEEAALEALLEFSVEGLVKARKEGKSSEAISRLYEEIARSFNHPRYEAELTKKILTEVISRLHPSKDL